MQEELSSLRELGDDIFSIARMYNQVKAAIDSPLYPQSGSALQLMLRHHKGQFRKGNEQIPYIVHPLMLACHALALELKDDELLATALLHDVVEDCDVQADELDVNQTVRDAVLLLSFSKGEDSLHAAKRKYYARIRENRIASMVKILDRCNNVSHMAVAFTPNKVKGYIAETEEHIYPLIDLVQEKYPDYFHAVFLLKYQMQSTIESLKPYL